MSDPAKSEDQDDSTGDDVRVHTQTPAEGPEIDSEEREDVPREHTQDPAEG
ncbi:MAG: hypothetical protein QOG01_2226 [Pseudonocardiales bacterium]|jgi:hypothetical protein|nr:hypothetical protein [Pseudonocardiales bacterium]